MNIKKIKRLVAVFVAFVVFAGLLFVAPAGVQAADYEFKPENVKSYTLGSDAKVTFTDQKEYMHTYWYKFTVTVPGIYEVKLNTVKIDHSGNGKKVKVFDDQGNDMLYLNKSSGERSEVVLLMAGEYYFYLSNTTGAYSDGTGTCRITRVYADEAYQDFEETYSDTKTRNNSIETATKIGVGTYHGLVAQVDHGNNQIDYYRINTTSAATITVKQTLYYNTLYAVPKIYDESGKVLYSMGARATNEKTLDPGIYYISIDGGNGNSSGKIAGYELTVKGAGIIDESHVHTLEAHEAIEPTCTETGMKAYWYCTECGKYFSDEMGNKEVTKDSLTVKALGHDWGEWTQTKAPTTTTAGEKQRVCKRNSTHVQTKAVAKLKQVTSITVPSGYTVSVGLKCTKKISGYTVKPADAVNKAVTFTSWDTSIATVNSKGVVTGVKVGETKVTIKAKDGSGKKVVVPITVSKPVVGYRSYVQKFGWQNWEWEGATSGTRGLGYRVEAMQIKVANTTGSVRYKAYVQREGWQDWKKAGETMGTKGQNKRIEAIRIELTGDSLKEYGVYYRTYVQHVGWLSWTRDGNPSGTSGFGDRVEAVQIKICRKVPKWSNYEKLPPQLGERAYIKRSDWEH